MRALIWASTSQTSSRPVCIWLLCNTHSSALLLLLLQAFGVTLACVAYNGVLVHNLARHHMLLFTSFLALPSALIRSMASRPCTVRYISNISNVTILK